jgi:hypothetical protein
MLVVTHMLRYAEGRRNGIYFCFDMIDDLDLPFFWWGRINFPSHTLTSRINLKSPRPGCVQEYVSLHAAAAAKVASSQAAEDPEDEEDAPAGVAAAAAAAVLASSKRGSGSARTPGQVLVARDAGVAGAAAASPSPAAGGRAGEAGGGYSAAEGQRRRKALLAELRMGVPRPAASLLVEPLLAAGDAMVWVA